jgi:hypothetical protein
MRIILEASKPRPKAREIDIAPAAAAAAAGAAAVIAPKAVPALAPEFAAPEPTLNADSLQRKTAMAAVPALESSSLAAAPMLAIAPLAVAAPAVVLVQPKLVEMVEPVIPARVRDAIGGLVEVWADLTIRADGTVAGVALVPPAPRQVQRYVVAALEKWRFEPLPAERLHRVQLVFNAGQ